MSRSKRQSRGKAKQQSIRSIKVGFSDENVTSFGGVALVERMAMRLGLWSVLAGLLPRRRGECSWVEIVKSAVVGLLTGSRGSAACEEVGGDRALLELLGVGRAPSESTFWRALARLGDRRLLRQLVRVQRLWAYRAIDRVKATDLLRHRFLPIFGDGSLLEGSRRREGTTYVKSKGEGLMWTAWFVGPFIATQWLASAKQGEQRCLRRTLRGVLRDVIDPLGMRAKALVLLDSLHGDGPTCRQLERECLKYIAGGNKLTATTRTLEAQPDCQWLERGARPTMGWSQSAVCACWIECEGWGKKRLLIGRRWMKQGELLYNYSGVITNLVEADVAHMVDERTTMADAIWLLYDMKAGYEDHFKDALEDLDGHHPPCQELKRNRGYYCLLTLAHTLGRAVDLLSGEASERGALEREDGGERKRATPRRMRLWRVRRRLLSVPGRVARHARQARVELLGLCATLRREFEARFERLCRC
jgi:hypothetical protein